MLYRKVRLTEASHRYSYALKKFPTEAELGDSGDNIATFQQLRINFLLNLSRCKRKMDVSFQCSQVVFRVDLTIAPMWKDCDPVCFHV